MATARCRVGSGSFAHGTHRVDRDVAVESALQRGLRGRAPSGRVVRLGRFLPDTRALPTDLDLDAFDPK